MSNILEVKKVNGSTTLIPSSNYNSLDFAEKLKCLINLRTAVEKEISWIERDLGNFVKKRKF